MPYSFSFFFKLHCNRKITFHQLTSFSWLRLAELIRQRPLEEKTQQPEVFGLREQRRCEAHSLLRAASLFHLGESAIDKDRCPPAPTSHSSTGALPFFLSSVSSSLGLNVSIFSRGAVIAAAPQPQPCRLSCLHWATCLLAAVASLSSPSPSPGAPPHPRMSSFISTELRQSSFFSSLAPPPSRMCVVAACCSF